MIARDEDLPTYLGSRHSAVGLLLVWFGVPTLVGGIIFAIVAADEVPFWLSISVAGWGLLAVPLGVSMRRRLPSTPLWLLANLLLGLALGAGLVLLLLGKNHG